MENEIEILKKEIEALQLQSDVAAASRALAENPTVSILVKITGPNGTEINHKIYNNSNVGNALWSDYYDLRNKVKEKEEQLKAAQIPPPSPEIKNEIDDLNKVLEKIETPADNVEIPSAPERKYDPLEDLPF